MGNQRKPRRSGTAQESSTLSVDEIIQRYPGKWIFMHVQECESGWPTRGVVLAHSASQKRIHELVRDRIRDGTIPHPYCVFKAIRFGRTVGDLDKILAKPGIEKVDA